MVPSRPAIRLHRAPARGGLGNLHALRSAPPPPGRAGLRRLHVWVAPCLRRGPHRSGRRHRALHAAEGPEAIGGRVLLFIGPFDGGICPGHRSRIRRNRCQSRSAGASGSGNDHRRRRLGNFSVDHRHPQSSGTARYLESMEKGPDGNSQPRPSRGAAEKARLAEPVVRGSSSGPRESQLADVSLGAPFRLGIRYGVRSRSDRHDRGRLRRRSAHTRRAVPAGVVCRGHDRHGYDRRGSDAWGV